ncbi:hypothetical protein MW887_004861 [Aspergillus wentii]|nr:hypothetical protein MW887_004861 [Aspergillus wentii]
MWDRKRLPHASYTLCTLHAHLPVPDGLVVKGDTPVHLDGTRRLDAPKRATFDIGVFEVPNMLSMNGKEPGSVGFRHYLELSVADSIRYTGPEKPRECSDIRRVSQLPAAKAYNLLGHYHDSYARCRDGTVYDRKKLLCEGPSAWKEIGVREINLKHLVDRLKTIRNLRQEILYGEKERTIADVESPRDLYNGLFTKFLHTPPHALVMDSRDKHSIKSQIKVLTTVLSTRGAWIDFGLVEWRLRVGQILWEALPHFDGDFLEHDIKHDDTQKLWIDQGLERKWFLIQMLLAGELLLRLDAIVRLGMSQKSRDPAVTTIDVYHYHKLRNHKVDWDLVVVRRFLDTLDISYTHPQSSSDSLRDPGRPHDKHHHSFFEKSLFESLTRKAPFVPESAWDCTLAPIRVKQQLQGLFVFAENIGWPRIDGLKERFRSRIGDGDTIRLTTDIYRHPIHRILTNRSIRLGKKEMYGRSPSRRLILLQNPREQDNTSSLEIGGWLSRSWISGFVIPGEAISHLLICTVLENDPDAMAKLGPVANLYGGFSYDGRSWWSKQCIVGRVLSSLQVTEACIAWMSSPILPVDMSTSKAIENTWFDVHVKETPKAEERPRIKQGNALSRESTPLGMGKLSSEEFSLPVDKALDDEPNAQVEFQRLEFSIKEQTEENRHITVVDEASMSFSLRFDSSNSPATISFPLCYNARFITSHECRRPFGIASCQCAPCLQKPQSPSTLQEHSRLPSHPLHKFYSYEYLPLQSLNQMPAPKKASSTDDDPHSSDKVIVVDARGSRDKETFVRAWCASVGADAIVGRIGRTCLSCCVREALAIDVRVVIRVGD